MNTQVSIGQIKRDISELVNRVNYAGDRIILTSRGKPKAALVSMQDFERLLKARDALLISRNGWTGPGRSPGKSRSDGANRWMWIPFWILPATTWKRDDEQPGCH